MFCIAIGVLLTVIVHLMFLHYSYSVLTNVCLIMEALLFVELKYGLTDVLPLCGRLCFALMAIESARPCSMDFRLID